MADIVIHTVIRKAVDIASNLAIEEGFRFSRLKENINWIESEMRYIQSYLEDVDSKIVSNKRVANLMSDIRGLGLDVEDMLDNYSIEIAALKRIGFFARLRSNLGIFIYIYNAHNFVVEIEGIKEKVNDINRRRQTYGIQERVSNSEEGTWDARRSFPHLEEQNVVGFEEYIKNLVARMLEEDSQCVVISITGMAGLGKTTLAKKVYNSCRQSFECSAWICVSQQPNIAELLRDIARQAGLEQRPGGLEQRLGFSFGIGSNLSKAKVLLDSIIVPHKLEILRLHYLSHQSFNIMDLNLHRYENLFRLHLYGHVIELPEYDKLPQNLTKLTLIRTCLEVDPMETLKKLPKLKILHFDDLSYIGEKMMVCSGGGPHNYPQLQVLDITRLYNLKTCVVSSMGGFSITMEGHNAQAIKLCFPV